MTRKDKTRAAHPVRVILGLAALTLLTARGAAGQVAPDGPWRTLDTPHFSVTFPAGSEALGRRAAGRAEAAYELLAEVLPEPDESRIELLLTDDVDFSNGLASVTPARRVVVYLRPPVDGLALANFDDWLDLVITHELAHIFHLDVTSGFGGFLRKIFGRLPAPWPFFPELGTPGWTKEGIATFYESEFTRAGRVRGSYFDMMLRTAALEGRFAPIDRVSGSSPEWPAGESAYLYGGLFFDYLVDTFGPGRVRAFVDAVGGQWIPYRLNAAARDAFEVSFSEAWRDWETVVREKASEAERGLEAAGGVTRPEVLTPGSRFAAHAAVGPNGSVVFARADGRSDPQLRLLDPHGGGSEFLLRTHGTATAAWTPGGDIVFSQLEYTDPYRIRSDLWSRDAAGRLTRLTRGGRLDHPDVSPDGTRAVAVRYDDTSARLVTVELANGFVQPLTSTEAEETWAFPAYSPDGAWVAATRWRPGGADIVVLDAETGLAVLEVTDDRAIDLAPTWMPDGTLLWGSDRSGIPQVVAVEVDPRTGRVGELRQVTRVVSGAAFPTVDPVSGWLYFSLYTSRGWELARVPLDPGSWGSAEVAEDVFQEGPPLRSDPVDGPIREYSAAGSLRPRFWQPVVLPAVEGLGGDILEPFVGFWTSAQDLVGRHSILLQGAVSLSGRELDGRLGYAYAGFGNPVLDVSVEQEWDGDGPFLAQRDSASPVERLYIREREQRVSVGATVTRRRWTSALSLGLRAGMVWEARTLLNQTFSPTSDFVLRRPESRLAEGRATLSFSTARGHALSVSREEGMSAFLLARTRREQALADSAVGRPGFDRSVDEFLGNLRLYQSFPGPGHADHVLALRVAGGVARGAGADQLTFEVGDVSGQTENVTGLNLFGGSSRFFPVRGYAVGTRSGRFAWAVSGEYRFPLALVNRGPGLFPLHLDRLHGALFMDTGNAWGPELGLSGFQQPREAAIWSAGIELSARVLALFDLPLQLRSGVAFPGVDVPGGTTATWYLVLGPSF